MSEEGGLDELEEFSSSWRRFSRSTIFALNFAQPRHACLRFAIMT